MHEHPVSIQAPHSEGSIIQLWNYAGTILASNILREILRGIHASWKRRMGKREVSKRLTNFH